MKKAQFLTPAVTLFTENGGLDVAANKALYDHLITGGIDGIVVMGSTGEFFAMTMEQKKALIDLAVTHIQGRVKCFVGTGAMTVADTVALSNYALEKGADAVMIVSPYYFPMSGADIEAYFDAVASQVKGAIYLYNFPGCTGADITPEITLRLLRKHENIKGFKDTVDELGHTRAIIEKTKEEFPDFAVLCGYDENLYHMMLSGGSGCIGGLSNFAPEVFAAWCKAINDQDLVGIEEGQKKVNSMMYAYSCGIPFPYVAKKALAMRGVPVQQHSLLFSSGIVKEEMVQDLLKKAGV